MKEFEQRLVDEHKDLCTRLILITKALESGMMSQIASPEYVAAMEKQKGAMIVYKEALEERMKILNLQIKTYN